MAVSIDDVTGRFRPGPGGSAETGTSPLHFSEIINSIIERSNRGNGPGLGLSNRRGESPLGKVEEERDRPLPLLPLLFLVLLRAMSILPCTGAFLRDT